MRKLFVPLAMAAMVTASVVSVLVLRSPSTPASTETPSTTLEASGKITARPTAADVPSLTKDPDSRRLYEEMLTCFPQDKSEFFDLFEQAPCYEDLVIGAAANFTPVDLLNAVKALVATRPDVITACHNGGHLAASILTKRLWSPSGSFDSQLDQMRNIMSEADDVCQNGYVHGFYDAIGQSSPNQDSFRAAAQVCYEVASATVDCSHGLGHAAWYSTKDFTKAAALCGVFEGMYRYGCDDGVIMYLPDYWSEGKSTWTADPRQPSWDVVKFYADAVEVCSWWPKERAGDPEPLRGCWSGVVAGILWRPISTLLDYGNYKDIAPEARDLIARAEAACMQFPPEGEEYCIDEWPGMVLYVAQNDPENIKDLCSGMVKYAARCAEDSLRQLEENLARDTETSRVSVPG